MPCPDAGHKEVVLNSRCTFVPKGGVDLDMSIEGEFVSDPMGRATVQRSAGTLNRTGLDHLHLQERQKCVNKVIGRSAVI